MGVEDLSAGVFAECFELLLIDSMPFPVVDHSPATDSNDTEQICGIFRRIRKRDIDARGVPGDDHLIESIRLPDEFDIIDRNLQFVAAVAFGAAATTRLEPHDGADVVE